jgi:hypothetical protein
MLKERERERERERARPPKRWINSSNQENGTGQKALTLMMMKKNVAFGETTPEKLQISLDFEISHRAANL